MELQDIGQPDWDAYQAKVAELQADEVRGLRTSSTSQAMVLIPRLQAFGGCDQSVTDAGWCQDEAGAAERTE